MPHQPRWQRQSDIDFAAMDLLSPEYDGRIEVKGLPSDFTDRIENRLLNWGGHRRANYVMRSKSGDAISFAAGFWTSYIVGLNDVELRRAGPNSIAYHVSWRPWATFVVINYLAVVVAVTIWVIVGMPGWGDNLARQSSFRWNLIAAAFLVGFVVPSLFVGMHRLFAARALESIVRQAVAT
jgi:hypothetical protein